MRKCAVFLLILSLAGVASGDAFYEDFDTYNPNIPDPAAGLVIPLISVDPNNGVGLGGWMQSDGGVGNGGGGGGGPATDILVVEDWGPQFFSTYPGTGNDGLQWRTPRTTGYAGVAQPIGSLAPGDVISWTMNIPSAPPFLHVVIGTDLADGNHNNDAGWLLDMGYAANDKIGYNGVTGNPYDAGAPGSWTEVELTMGAGLNTVDIRARNWTRQWNGDNPATSTVTNNADPSNAIWNTVGTFNTGGLPSDNLWLEFAGEMPASGTPFQHGTAFDQVNVAAAPLTLLNNVTVDEDGATSDTVTLQVNSVPAVTTTIDIVSEDPNEEDFTVTPKQFILNPLTLDPNNLPQLQVTVQAVDDLELEDQQETFKLQAVPSGDPDWFASNSATVTVLDNDSIVITDDGMAVSEEGLTSDSYTLELGVAPASDDVVIDVTTDNSQITLDKAKVTFTTGDWNIPQMITATAVDDSVGEGDPHTVVISHAVSSTDAKYVNVVAADDVSVSVSDNDCDPAGPFLAADDTGPAGVPDCQVNLFDFGLWALQWLSCSLPNVPGCVTP